MHDKLPPKVTCSGSLNLFKFWETSDNISKTVHERAMVVMEDGKKLYRIVTIANDLK